MKKLTMLMAVPALTMSMTVGAEHHEAIADTIASDYRAEANTERDGARKPDQVLGFIGLGSGDVVLDWGSGGGYWAELFSGIVGADGKIYAHQNAGERFDSQKDGLMAQYEPFGNVELMPTERGAAIPLDDGSVDTVFISYLFHHMHYADGSGESFPDSSTALFGEYMRILKPGGTVIIIEHAAADGSGRAESGGWHRTPPEMAKSDMTGLGYGFVADAPEIFNNPDANLGPFVDRARRALADAEAEL